MEKNEGRYWRGKCVKEDVEAAEAVMFCCVVGEEVKGGITVVVCCCCCHFHHHLLGDGEGIGKLFVWRRRGVVRGWSGARGDLYYPSLLFSASVVVLHWSVRSGTGHCLHLLISHSALMSFGKRLWRMLWRMEDGVEGAVQVGGILGRDFGTWWAEGWWEVGNTKVNLE